MGVMCGGQFVEYISEYTRVHEMISKLQPGEANGSDNIEGFGVGVTDHVNDQQCHHGMAGQRLVLNHCVVF